MLISIAIPCYRSEKNLETVVNDIRNEFADHEEYDYQIILVCDGSPDHTDEVIRDICAKDPKITGVLLSRNYTQGNAKMAALPYVRGDVLVYMDDDGQHPVAGIFRLAEKILEGYDVVYANFETKHQSHFKIWTSNLNGAICEKLGIRPKGLKISSFVAYSRFAADQLKQYDSPTPSPGSYMYSVTTKVTNIEMEQKERLSGKSGYTLKKLIGLAITTYTNFTIVPLRMIDIIGCLAAVAGIIYGIVLIFQRIFTRSYVPGYTSNMVAILIIGGLILVSLGLVGEYIGRIYLLLSKKPQYVVRETINDPPKDE